MFKKILCAFVCLLILFSLSIAEDLNLKSMTFDELLTLKQKIDCEYLSRPESEGYKLTASDYYVGTDIAPGTYYIAMVYPDKYSNSVSVSLYGKDDSYDSIDCELSEDPQRIVLKNGDTLHIGLGSGILLKQDMFNPLDYYKYEPPEGVIVQPGIYVADKDIPLGKYTICPASTATGYFRIYNSETPHDWKYYGNVRVLPNVEHRIVQLTEGDILEVHSPICITKTQVLKFD